MLVELGLKDQVWETFLREDIATMDALVGLERADLKSIGVTLGAANRILKAAAAKTADGPAP